MKKQERNLLQDAGKWAESVFQTPPLGDAETVAPKRIVSYSSSPPPPPPPFSSSSASVLTVIVLLLFFLSCFSFLCFGRASHGAPLENAIIIIKVCSSSSDDDQSPKSIFGISAPPRTVRFLRPILPPSSPSSPYPHPSTYLARLINSFINENVSRRKAWPPLLRRWWLGSNQLIRKMAAAIKLETISIAVELLIRADGTAGVCIFVLLTRWHHCPGEAALGFARGARPRRQPGRRGR